MTGSNENEMSLYGLFKEREGCTEKKGFVVCRDEGLKGER